MITDYFSHVSFWDFILFAELILTCFISWNWSLSALSIARTTTKQMFIRAEIQPFFSTRHFYIPYMVWRWRVTFWMLGKSIFFTMIVFALIAFDTTMLTVPLWYYVLGQILTFLFTIFHTYAWLGWKQLPMSDAGRLGVR